MCDKRVAGDERSVLEAVDASILYYCKCEATALGRLGLSLGYSGTQGPLAVMLQLTMTFFLATGSH